MSRGKNDATLQKIGDIYQYYIALYDCFKLNNEDTLLIEVNGDVSIKSKSLGKTFQKEVKHHLGEKYLSDRDIDFWKTLSNWYIDYDRSIEFYKLVLFTTSIVSEKSIFYLWNSFNVEERIETIKSIGNVQKERESEFRKYYNNIFDEKNFDEDKLKNIVKNLQIDSSRKHIQNISEEFSSYIGHIPIQNRDQYIAALLGRILDIVKEPPHFWEVTRTKFDEILQQESYAHGKINEKPLPLEFMNKKISKEEEEQLSGKNFVEEIRKIEYEEKIPNAISDYWKAQMTVMRYFNNDISYTRDLPNYKEHLKERLVNKKDLEILKNDSQEKNIVLKKSKIMYIEIMGWEIKDYGSIIKNQGFFQRGIIHDIVEEKEFTWNIGEKNEY